MTRNTPWKRGVDKGGAAGSGIGNRARPLQGRTPAMKIDQTDFNTVSASDSVDNTVRVRPVYPDAISAMCAKLATNMSQKQWNEWVSPDIHYVKACPNLPIAPE